MPGTLINIQNIELLNVNNEKLIVPLKDVYASSKSSFLIEAENDIKILVTNYRDEKIKINFSQLYKNIIQIKININFSKTNLTNKDKLRYHKIIYKN